MAHHKTAAGVAAACDQSSVSADLRAADRQPIVDTRTTRSMSATGHVGLMEATASGSASPIDTNRQPERVENDVDKDESSVLTLEEGKANNAMEIDSIPVVKTKKQSEARPTNGDTTSQKSSSSEGKQRIRNGDESSDDEAENENEEHDCRKDDDALVNVGRQSNFQASETPADKHFDISIDLNVMPYTTADLQEALSDWQNQVTSSALSRLAPSANQELDPERIDVFNVGATLLRSIPIHGLTGQHESSVEPSNVVVTDYDSLEISDDTEKILEQGRIPVDAESRGRQPIISNPFGSQKSPCETIRKFMGELLSSKDTDLLDLSDHEIVSSTDLNGVKDESSMLTVSHETRDDTTPSRGTRRKTVRFTLADDDFPSDSLTKKVSGILSSPESSSSSSSSSSFGCHLEFPASDQRGEFQETDAHDSNDPIGATSTAFKTMGTSPRILLSERDLPVIKCPNQEQGFDIEDIMPSEIVIESILPLSACSSTSSDDEKSKQSFGELMDAFAAPALEMPTCDTGCARYFSEIEQARDSLGEGEAIASEKAQQQGADFPDAQRPVADTPPQGAMQGSSNEPSRFDHDNSDPHTGAHLPGYEAYHRGSFSANDLPMAVPTAIDSIREHSDDTSASRCSSGSMKVIPASSIESLPMTDQFQTSLDPASNLSSETSLQGLAAAPVVLQRSLQYLAQIQQLENMVQDGNKQIALLQEERSTRDRDVSREMIAIRQSLERELEETRTQSWMVQKQLNQQIKGLTADNASLLKQVNHTTNRMQELERTNMTIAVQYHNALGTLKAMERDQKHAQDKIQKLQQQLDVPQSEDSSGRNVEQILSEKQELIKSVQRLEDRLVGQKEVNSRLLSEIEKIEREREEERKRMNEEKEKEFNQKSSELRSKLSIQTALLSKEHSTTEILKAEFTSIRRELEAQISSKDIEIEELRRRLRSADNDDQLHPDKAESQDPTEAELQEILHHKESEIRVLHSALTEENKKVVDYQTLLKGHEVQLSLLENAVKEREQYLQDATNTCRRLKRQKNELREQLEVQGTELGHLRTQLESRDRSMVQLASDLSRRDRRIMALLKDLRRQSSSSKATMTAPGCENVAASSSSPAASEKLDGSSQSDQSCGEEQEDETMTRLEKRVKLLKQQTLEADSRAQAIKEHMASRFEEELKRVYEENEQLRSRLEQQSSPCSGCQESPVNDEVPQRDQPTSPERADEIAAQIATLQDTIRSLEADLENERAKQQERDETTGEIDTLREEVEASRREAAEFREEMEERRRQSESQISNLSSLVDSYKNHMESQQVIRKDSEHLIEHYIAENTELKARLDEVMSEHERMATEIAAAEELKTYVLKEKERLEAENSDLQTTVTCIKQDRVKIEEQHQTVVDHLSQKLDQKHSELSAASSHLDQVLSQLRQSSDHTQDLSRRLAERDDELRSITADISHLESDCNKTAAENTVISNERNVAIQQIEALEKERNELQESMRQSQVKNEELVKEVNDLHLRLSCEMNSYQLLKTLHQNSEDTKKEQADRIRCLETDLAQLSEGLKSESNRVGALTEQNQHLENEMKQVQAQRADFHSEVEVLKRQLESERQVHQDTVRAEQERASKCTSELEQRLRESEERIEKLLKTIELKKKRMTKLKKEIASRETEDNRASSTVSAAPRTQEGETPPNSHPQQQVTQRDQQQGQQPQQLQQEQPQQHPQFSQILLQEAQNNRVSSLLRDISQLRESLTDSRCKLNQLNDNHHVLCEENEHLVHELEAANKTIREETKSHQDDVENMKDVARELKQKRIELMKAKKVQKQQCRRLKGMTDALSRAESSRNELSQENTRLTAVCQTKDTQIELLQAIFKTNGEEAREHSVCCETTNTSQPRDDTEIKSLTNKLVAAESEIRSVKVINCRLNIDLQVKCDFLENQKAECSRLQAALYDKEQIVWDLTRRLDDAKHKLQTEKQLRVILQQRHDDEMCEARSRASARQEEQRSESNFSSEVHRRLAKLEDLIKARPVEAVNASDDQREIHGLRREICKLESFRDSDRMTIDELCADLGELKSLLTSERQRPAFTDTVVSSPSNTESRSTKIQRALRKAELQAALMTSVSNYQSTKSFHGSHHDVPTTSTNEET